MQARLNCRRRKRTSGQVNISKQTDTPNPEIHPSEHVLPQHADPCRHAKNSTDQSNKPTFPSSNFAISPSFVSSVLSFPTSPSFLLLELRLPAHRPIPRPWLHSYLTFFQYHSRTKTSDSNVHPHDHRRSRARFGGVCATQGSGTRRT